MVGFPINPDNEQRQVPIRIEPDIEQHQRLEDDVSQFLIEQGFLVDDATYHDNMDERVVRVLQNIYTPTGLYLRGRADRVAVRGIPPMVFEWEAKTHVSRARHDITVEALPLCHHIVKARLDVKCLYCYRNEHKGHEVGFWIHDMPEPRIIMIPNRWRPTQQDWFEEKFREIIPGVDIRRIGRTRGANDPFVIIDESKIADMPHWKDLILQEIESERQNNVP